MSSVHKHLEQGREMLGCGDYTGALGHADAALTEEADSFDALQLRSRALFMLGRDTEALQTLRKVRVVLHRPLPEPPPSDDLPARDPFANDELAPVPLPVIDALETLLALRERYTLDSELLALLAELAEDAGRFEIAHDAFAALVHLDPRNLEAWEGLVHVLAHQDLAAACQTLNQALKIFPDHALFHEFLGFFHFRRRQYREAIDAYQHAVDLGADHPDNFEAQIQCYLALDDNMAALGLLALLVDRWGNDVETYRFAVEAALQCGDADSALQFAHQLVRLQPTHSETYCYKAWAEIEQDDWEAAERSLRLGFHKAVDGAFSLFELVEMLISDDEPEAAMRVADLAYDLAPDHPESSAARGKVLREMGAFQEALAAFRQAMTLAPQDDAYQTWVGVVLDNMGDYREAIQQFNRVLARHPRDVWTLSNRGLSFLAQGMADRALADFNRCLEFDPQEAPLHFWQACAYAQLNNREDALRSLRHALDMHDEILSWMAHEPSLDPLRSDPRFQALLEESGAEGLN